MRDLASSASVLECMLDLNYLFASLDADEETRELASEVEDALTKGEGLYSKRYEFQKVETRKQALVSFYDKDGDRSIMETSRFSVAINGGVKSTGHTSLFPIAANKMVRLAYEKQKEATRQLIKKLEGLGDQHALAPFIKKLSGYLSRFEGAQAASSEAKRNRALHSHHIEEWRAEVKKLRRGIFGELTALFPDDKPRVEAYFRPGDERSTEEADESTPEKSID